MAKIFTRAVFMATLLTLAVADRMYNEENNRVLEENEEKCEVGEQYLDCGSECPEACYNLGQPRACGLRCKSGCFCEQGLVRNPDGDCVAPAACPHL